jgi:C_GCAxxG_C_C family probable redox protein
MIGMKDGNVLKAITGLEGGAVANGSTCGVISGGSLGIALMYADELEKNRISAESKVLEKVGEYVDWFQETFGTTLCRQRTGVNFYSPQGQVRYFLPGDRLSRCLWHINKAMQKIYADQDGLNASNYGSPQNMCGKGMHCAEEVLKGVRERTKTGDELLEKMSFVFDGGIGLRGGLCGALAGALLALSLASTVKNFFIGHLNLLIDEPIGKRETFGIGKRIVDNFVEQAGALECGNILEKEFTSRDDFQQHIHASGKCRDLMDLAVHEASKAIENLVDNYENTKPL